MFVTINGRRRHLWRTVDQDSNVLDVLVQSRRNTEAAKRFFRKGLAEQCRVPRSLVTDKLGSYEVAHREVMPSVEHQQSRYRLATTVYRAEAADRFAVWNEITGLPAAA